MREGPVEVYHRARSTFLKALEDGIGKADAAAEYHFALLNLQRHGVVVHTNNNDVHLQKMVDIVIKEEQEEAWEGEQAAWGGAAGAPVQPSPWAGRIAPAPDEVTTRWMADSIGPAPSSFAADPMSFHYPTESPFDRDIDPDMELAMNPLGGVPVPNYIERAISYVLPSEAGGESKSEEHRRKEIADYNHQKKTGAINIDPSIMSPLALGNTAHERFERDFERWKTGPGAEVHAEAMPDEESQHELLKEYLRWKVANDWSAGTFGDFGRLHGLYWESPAEIKDIQEHLANHGGDNPNQQFTDHGFHMGRLKRSIKQHLHGMYEAFGRDPDMTGANTEAMPIPIGEAQRFTQRGLMDEVSNYHSDLLDFYHTMTGTHRTKPHLMEVAGRGGRTEQVLRSWPRWSAGDGEFIDRTEDKAKKQGLDADTLLVMAGIDPETRELYPDGQHPVYDGWLREFAPFQDPNDVFDIMNATAAKAHFPYEAREIQNAELPHTMMWVDPEHFPEEVTEGSNEGFGYHFGYHHSYRGGHGRNRNTMMRMLHDLWTHDTSPTSARSVIGESDAPGFARAESVLSQPEPSMFTAGPLAHSYSPPFFDLNEGGTYGTMSFALAPREKQTVRTGKGKVKNIWVPVPGRSDHARNIHGAHVRPGPQGGKASFERTMSGRNGAVVNAHRKALHADYVGNRVNSDALSDGEVQLLDNVGGVSGFKTTMLRNGDIGVQRRGAERREDTALRMTELVESLLGFHRHYMDPRERSVHHPDEIEDDDFSTGSRSNWNDLMDIAQVTGRFDVDLEEQLNALNHQVVEAREEYHRARTEGDFMAAQQALDQMNTLQEQHDDLEERLDEGVETKDISSKRGYERRMNDEIMPMLRADNRAVMSEVGKMVQEAISQGIPLMEMPQRDLRQVLMNFAKHANSYINRFPHEVHGQTSFGLRLSEQKRLTPGGGGLQNHLKEHLHGEEPWLGVNTPEHEIFERLGLDEESEHDQEIVKNLREQLKSASDEDPAHLFNAQTVRQIIEGNERYSGRHEGGADVEGFERMGAKQSHEGGRKLKTIKAHPLHRDVNAIYAATRAPEAMRDHGIHWVTREKAYKRQTRGRDKDQLRAETVADTLRRLNSVMLSNPKVTPEARTHHTTKVHTHAGDVPIGEAGTPHGNAITSMYDSPGFLIRGNKVNPSVRVMTDGKGNRTYHTVDELREMGVDEQHLGSMKLLPLSREFLTTVAPDVDFKFDKQHQVLQDEVRADKRVDRFGRRHDSRYKVATDGPVGLAALTNPDLLIKGDAERPPPLQPMHRIFNFSDLEELRGFTGDWVVSTMPEGHRIFLKREDDEVTANDLDGDYKLPDEVKEAAKKTTGANFVFDVIVTEEGEYKVFDLLEFDDKDVYDVPSQERIKILRGAIESVDPIEMPGAYNTRLTDDAGLEATVESLQKEDERILLRDAKSVYMKGEKRHPKWVLLAPGKDVVLMVLERRGSGPYSYRLGTGPITQGDKIGDRAVEVEGETYMDVGTAFDSDEKYEQGDLVSVNVDSITSFEEGEEKIFSVHAGSIEGEAEGEAITSRETLDLMKGIPMAWPHEVRRSDRHISVRFPQGQVLYKATMRGDDWSVHSPQADSQWLIRMSESQRPFWSPLAGLMLKGGYGMEDGEEKAEVHETEGEGEPLIPPKKVEGTDHWKKVVEGLKAVEKAMSGSPGHAWSGAQGLGIDMATPIESPTGPTKTRDESTLPDYDGRPRPEEEVEEEDEDLKNRQRLPGSEIDMDVEADGEMGHLHVDDDSAVLHM